jgi:intracellular sulfur oxidation DsrE/DsrF family protein
LGHVTAGNGQSLTIAINIVQFLEAQDLQKEKINTVVHGGVIQSIEEKLNKPLQWLRNLLVKQGRGYKWPKRFCRTYWDQFRQCSRT